MYFKNIDSEFCHPLESFLEEAKQDGLENITLYEAIPDGKNPHFVWCLHYGDCIERDDCRKSECTHYTSKSGRGLCSNRGILYQHGEKANFKVK